MEKIKYHEHRKGENDYGADYQLTNNWIPDEDYGNEYVNIYFNIDTDGFDSMCGSFTDNTKHDIWAVESDKIIAEFGYINGTEYDTQKSENKAYLYPHPNQFSGVIPKNDVKRVAERIAQSKIFKLRWVDLHETVYIISDNEYEEYLNGKNEQIQEALFKACGTTRINLFYNSYDVARSLAGKFRLRRLGLNDGKNHSEGQTIDHIVKVIDKMIDGGLLVSMEKSGVKYVRSLNKTEQRKKFKKLLYV